VQDLENGKACMCVKRVVATLIVRAKYCHACDNNEMQMKTETMLLQANIHENNSKRSLKSRRQHSHKEKDKK